MSLGKKKKKAKSKKEKLKVDKNISDDSLNHIKNINEELDPLFEEVGLKRNDHRIYKVKADGACASNCVAAHCHGDCKLGTYVRQNLNIYLTDNWPSFQPYFTFPRSQMAGFESVPFPNEEEYLKFLKNDPRAGKLWADHHDLQIVANAYGIKVHILTVGVVSKDGPKARWTHLDPDGKLGSLDGNASKMHGGIWLLQRIPHILI